MFFVALFEMKIFTVCLYKGTWRKSQLTVGAPRVLNPRAPLGGGVRLKMGQESTVWPIVCRATHGRSPGP